MKYIELNGFVEKKTFMKSVDITFTCITINIDNKFHTCYYVFRKGVVEEDYITTIINQDKYDKIIEHSDYRV